MAGLLGPAQPADYHRMKKDPRRLRLLAAACVRQVIPVDAFPLIGQVIDVIERYVDGAATRADFLAARKAARKAINSNPRGGPRRRSQSLVGSTRKAGSIGCRSWLRRCRTAGCLDEAILSHCRSGGRTPTVVGPLTDFCGNSPTLRSVRDPPRSFGSRFCRRTGDRGDCHRARRR